MRKLFTILFVITALAASSFAQTWYTNPNNGHQYAYTSRFDFSWVDAENESLALGGHLASVADATEENWLKSTFGSEWFWIGFTDQAAEGNWVWSSGELVTYTDWNPGEPNNQGGAENWAGMTWPQSPGWNDFPDWYTMYGVVEVVPEPSTITILALGALALMRRRRH